MSHPPFPPKVSSCRHLSSVGPPSPSDDGVTYEQPLRCLSFLSYFQGVCFGHQARKIFCVQIGRIMPLKDGKCILSEHFFLIKTSCEFCF